MRLSRESTFLDNLYNFSDYDYDDKKSDDILDFMLRKKYEGTNIIFKSMADLRRDLPSQESLRSLQLIKAYQEKIRNENQKDQV